MTMTDSNNLSPPLNDDYNGWADFWRYKIGVNVIPADTRKKVTYESWSEWQDKPIPQELHNDWKAQNAFYKPNYEGIKRIYAINTAKLLRLENEKKTKNEADRDVNAGADARNVNNANILPPVDLVSKLYIEMLKEIIICDYNHVDYNPEIDDDLLSLATLVKSRKKVTGLLTKGIEQQDADQFGPR